MTLVVVARVFRRGDFPLCEGRLLNVKKSLASEEASYKFGSRNANS
jgi:hypothetical protein